jgi:hypothetical protein
VRACPIWRLPVTFGGGKGTTKTPSGFGEPSGAVCGLKKPWASHQSYQAASTACGLYPAAIGWDKSMHTSVSETGGNDAEWATFLVALGGRVDERGLVCLLFFLCLGLFLACWCGCGLLELLRGQLCLLFESLCLLLGWDRVSYGRCAERRTCLSSWMVHLSSLWTFLL